MHRYINTPAKALLLSSIAGLEVHCKKNAVNTSFESDLPACFLTTSNVGVLRNKLSQTFSAVNSYVTPKQTKRPTRP